jgi:S1-C subfamily serine protease
MTEPSFLAQLSATIVATAAKVAPSIVEIASHRSLASGFLWREGLIITADEALSDEGKILVEFADGTQHPANVVGRDPSTDIALLRVESAGAPSPVSVVLSQETPRPGALVVVAAAAESAPLVSFGSAVAVGPAWRSMRGGKIDARIELDARLRRRAEGGLAISAEGNVLGMAVRGPAGRTLVIPSATIESAAAVLLEHGKVPRGYLGLGLHQVLVTGGGQGAMVMSVDPDGPAEIGGILQGDIILRWNGETVPSVNALVRTLDHHSIGQSVSLGIRRAGADVDAAVTIATRPRG